MAGFTPINASSRHRPTETQAESADNIRQPSLQPVTAACLGTAQHESAANTSNQALHGPGAKKASGKGRKRTDTTLKDASKTKRRKTGDVSEGMTVTKPGERGAKKATPKPSEQRNPGETPQHHEQDALPVRPLPVYVQPTSMDMIPSSGQQTSMEAVRSAAGPGCTLYNSRTPTSAASAIDITQPWLSVANLDRTRPAINTRVLRPRHDKIDPATVQGFRSANASTSASRSRLPTPFASDSAPEETLAHANDPPTRRDTLAGFTQGDEFIDIDDHDEADLIDLTTAVEESVAIRERTPPFRERKQNIRAVEEHEDYGGALLTDTEKQHLEGLRMTSTDTNRPIVRKPFPQPVLDRSPIFGTSANTVLRTCFRVGEALNTGAQAVRTNKNVLLELYCRVTQSWREPKPGRKQHFVFKDLYHDNPPHLNGTFELWDQSRLWELDSVAFLTLKPEGTMARVIAKMKRDGQKWRLEVMNIWEASWEDVEHVAGIYVR